MSAFAWLNDFARWLAAWVPRLTLVPPTHRAILFGPRGGAVERGPGIVFWWPIAQKMRRIPTVPQAMETCSRLLPLAPQVSGGPMADIVPRAAVVGLVIEFTIVDPLLAALATTQLRAIIDNRVQARFGKEWSGQVDSAAAVAERTATATGPGLLRSFGVRLDSVQVGNAGPVASIKLVNDWSHSNADDDDSESAGDAS